MSSRWERTRELTRGIWLVGIGLMLVRNRILPDVLFLVGAVRLVEAGRHPERRRSQRAGVALIALGLCLAFGLSLAETLLLGVASLFVFRWLEAPAPGGKPIFDARLD